jgi:hypothetical protein
MSEKFNTEILEPEEATVVDFNPLDEAVNEKSYSNANINVDGMNFTSPIDEPTFTPPPIQKKVVQQEQTKREPINPEMNNLGKKDTQMAASHMANLIINGYEWMHELANKGLQVSEKRLSRLQAEGEINLNAMIDYDYGKKIRAGDFFQEYNLQASQTLKVSQEFKDEATPLLEKVLAKRGVGLTDEQMLMFVFGKDIAAKSMMFFQMKSQLNYMIQSIKESTTSQYAQAAPQPQPQPQSQPQPQTQQVYEPEEQPYEQPKAAPIKPDVIIDAPKKKGGRPKKY